ncbi:tetratricopeptide repeat protein [Streptomyces sp. NPDC019890]|uniref:tetratricopeptide repeat protein n=1 Tax=Streptomyces sp. NPDC019890 TaxID=3365064 RepID=UPI00384FB9C5
MRRRTRIPDHELHREPSVDDLPLSALLLATALASAVRIEPELIRVVRLRVRPTLDVGAESSLWFGPWAAHRPGQYMVLRRPVLLAVRQKLVHELQQSSPGDAIRTVGEIIEQVHHDLPPVLAMEEQVTWNALLADAGVDPPADLDQMLQSALRTAVEDPHRRDGLRRWFSQAWHRLPERARQTSTALDLHELLGEPGGHLYSAELGPSVSAHVRDVVLPVRHDGASLAFGDSTWPADGILVPDTQPRILQVTHDVNEWRDAVEVRVPRSGFTATEATHVPMYVRTARGLVYRVGAPGGSEVISRPPSGHPFARKLLGRPIADLKDHDYLHFGIAPRLPDIQRTGVIPPLETYQPRRVDALLRSRIESARHHSQLVVVRGRRGSGRTRTAWEALRSSLANWWAWSPPPIDRNQAILRALNNDGIGSHTVLWLDDLDVALADPDTGEALANALIELLEDPARHPVLLLATIQDVHVRLPRLGQASNALLRHAETLDITRGTLRAQPFYTRTYPVGSLPPAPRQPAGRQAALEGVLSALSRDRRATTLTLITGVGGVGKTTLAVQAAHLARRRGWFSGGVLKAAMGYEASPWPVLLRELGCGDYGRDEDESSLRALCAAQLMLLGDRTRPVLLVLDDVTQPQLRDIAAITPSGFTLLATSHQAITLPDVRMIELGPLHEEDALQLLQFFLEQRSPEDTRIHRGPLVAREIVRLCGRFPLALAIAAGWLTADPGRSLAELQALLQRHSALDLPHYGDTPVRRALDITFQRVTPQQRSAFCLLALLPGPDFSDLTASVLIEQPENIHRVLENFALYHLITKNEESGRWQMHPILQTYGRAVADEYLKGAEVYAAQMRVVDSALSKLVEADRLTRGHRAQAKDIAAAEQRNAALAWLRAEQESLVALAGACFEWGQKDKASDLAMGLAPFLFRQKEFTSLLQLMAEVYSWAQQQGDGEMQTAALNNLAVSNAAKGDYEQARAALAKAADLPTARSQSANYLQMLSNLGAVLLHADQTQEAIVVLKDALAQHQADRPAGLVSLLCNLGAALHQAGDAGQALRVLVQAEQQSTRSPLPAAEEGSLFRNLAEVLADTGNTERATYCFERALASFTVLGDHEAQARVHRDLGGLYLRSELAQEAIDHLHDARTLFTALNNTAAAADVCNDLGLALHSQGRYEEALDQLLTARTLHEHSHNELEAAVSLRNIGNILLHMRRYPEAIPALRNASAHLEALGDQHGQAQALTKLGRAFMGDGDLPAACMALTRSAELYQQLDIEQSYRQRGDIGGQGSTTTVGELASQAHLENSLREEVQTLRSDLLSASHLLTSAGEQAEASKVLHTALALGRSPSV